MRQTFRQLFFMLFGKLAHEGDYSMKKQQTRKHEGILRRKIKETCGQCIGLTKESLVDKVPCNSLGILESNKACGRFQPDVFGVQELIENKGSLLVMAQMMRHVSTSKLDLLASIIANDKRNRRNGVYMGKRVFVRYCGAVNANYRSNFMVAYVLYADKGVIRLVGQDGGCCITVSVDDYDLNGPSVYSAKNFKPLLQQMKAQSRAVDPRVERGEAKRLRIQELFDLNIAEESLNGKITTIDSVIDKKSSRSAERDLNDLAAIVRDIDRGFTANSSYFHGGRQKPKASSLRSKQRKKPGKVKHTVSGE